MNNNYNSYMQPNVYSNGRFYNNYNPQPQIYNFQTDLPIQSIRFVDVDQMQKHIVFPNTTEMLIDKDKKIVQIKSTDQIGYSTARNFKFEEVNEINQKEPTQVKNEPQVDFSQYVKKEDLADFIKTSDLKNINDKLSMIEKKISLNNIIGEK